ncbi:L,D-transpeptidase family protein [Modestobacter sp. L9-4]|uniref:L,D-transpeptidase n=1 Tax=Modestobacter sp. L9-4 TaxID=2851567 RepID=UPI001C77D16E|nr:Ig-like domain-containing protein [Modestobacter sp. L9-4]QXG75419.1 L,D-transpeptidase family protein [Modestobacter sp. L9-4]
MGVLQGRRSAPVLAVAVLALVAGCTGGSTEAAGAPGSTTSSASSAPAAPPAQLALSIADGAADVSPAEPLEVDVTDGRLDDVEVTDGSGAAVAGEVAPAAGDPDTSVWTPAEDLAYGTSYTVTATAASAGDQVTTQTSTFTTVTPRLQDKPDIGPLDGTTVGVGMPIRVFFDEPVTDKAEVERHLTVTSSTPTDGVWNWVRDDEVHFRPSTYWPADTDVTVEADLFGVDLGDGVWGKVDRTVAFHVGDEHVSVADAATHTLTVHNGDQVVQTYPMSAGSDKNPTHNGAHVVLEKLAETTMDSSTFGLAVDAPGGYLAEGVKWATRISNNGEFVHGAPWSVRQQGSSNVSHGCINLSDERAKWFYDFSQPGDVVEVVNSVGGTLGPADGDIYDWAVPWDQWKAGSALS